jgi:hypothetical protein
MAGAANPSSTSSTSTSTAASSSGMPCTMPKLV